MRRIQTLQLRYQHKAFTHLSTQRYLLIYIYINDKNKKCKYTGAPVCPLVLL